MNGGSHLRAAIFCYIFIQDLVNSEKGRTFATIEPPSLFTMLKSGVVLFIHLLYTIMARPIKETPILTGKDAERFVKRMNEKRTVSNKEIERVKKNYEYILSIAKF